MTKIMFKHLKSWETGGQVPVSEEKFMKSEKTIPSGFSSIKNSSSDD